MSATLFMLTALGLFGIGLVGALTVAHPIRRILALNVMGSGVLLLLVAIGYRGVEVPADPVPHALVLTGIVVAVAATALALVLMVRLNHDEAQGEAEDE